MSFALKCSLFAPFYLIVFPFGAALTPSGISRLAQRQLSISVVRSPIKELAPRTWSLSWMSFLNWPIGYNERFLNSIAPPIMPSCVCTIELMLMAPTLTRLLLRPPLMTTYFSLEAITNMCFWCTCAWDMSLFLREAYLLLIHMLCQLHIRHAGVCAGAHIANSCDEQDLCGRTA